MDVEPVKLQEIGRNLFALQKSDHEHDELDEPVSNKSSQVFKESVEGSEDFIPENIYSVSEALQSKSN